MCGNSTYKQFCYQLFENSENLRSSFMSENGEIRGSVFKNKVFKELREGFKFNLVIF